MTDYYEWLLADKPYVALDNEIADSWFTVRVDGRAMCPHCFKPYEYHRPLLVDGFEYFHVGCNHELLKL